MTTILCGVVVITAILVVVDVSITGALIRRLRASAPEAPALRLGVKPGQRIAPFEPVSTSIGPIGPEDLATGRWTIAFLSATCPHCRTQLPRFVQAAEQGGPSRFVAAIEGDADRARDLREALSGSAVLAETPSAGTGLAHAFGIEGFPTFVVLSQGTVISASFSSADLPMSTAGVA